MPSFQDSAVLVLLALLLFGPKKLPVLARQLGKLMADFRRASNEFRAQMEEELRISEQAERQKQVAAIEAPAPSAPAIEAESTPPHEPPPAPSFVSGSEPESNSATETVHNSPIDSPAEVAPEPAPFPVPIATSGNLSILPPSTGLPTPNSSPSATSTETTVQPHEAELETETLHG